MRIEYHRTLIADHVRNRILHDALKRAIVPGETIVADIGAGTGLLGLMAAGLGAKEVFFYETAEVAQVAEAVIAANGFSNCHLMPCHSLEMHDPPRAHVIVSETLGNYAFEEDIITTLNDAVERFLLPDGVVLPRGVRQFVAPVTGARIDTELRAWEVTGPQFGLDLVVPQRMSLNNAYVRTLAEEELLAGPGRQWDAVTFDGAADPDRRGGAAWVLTEAVTVYGFAVWWEADFGGDLWLSTAPGAPATHWEQLYFPLMAPMRPGPGSRLGVEIASMSGPDTGTHLAWRAEVRAADGTLAEVQEMDLDKGYLP